MRRTIDLSAFAGYTYSTPDYGMEHNSGVTGGADFTRYLGHLDPSFEVRGTYTSGPRIKESDVLIGVRILKDFHRVHPYGDFLGGLGSLHYAVAPCPVCSGDKGFVVSYGGGANYDLLAHVALKADIQSQYWDLGVNGVLKPQGGNYTLTPFNATIGVEYQIPFRAYTRAHDPAKQ